MDNLPGPDGLMAVFANQIPGLVACGATERLSHNGFAYMAQSLARSGIIVVSIQANDVVNAIQYETAGATLLEAHVSLWSLFQSGAVASPLSTSLAGRVGLDRVGLVGHSRGGAIVTRVHNTNTIPGVTYRASYLMAPVQPSSPVTGIPVALVSGGRDADVYDLPLAVYDQSTVPTRSLQYLYGANHSRFNSSWLDDAFYITSASGTSIPDLTGAQQRYLTAAFVRSWFDWHLLNVESVRNRALASGDADVDVLRDGILTERPIILPSFSASDDVTLDDFENLNPATTSPLGAPVTTTGSWTTLQELTFSWSSGGLNTTFWHATNGLVAGWPATGPTVRFGTPGSGVAPGNRGVLQMRLAVVQEPSMNNPQSLSANVSIVGAGGTESVAVAISSVATVPRPYPSVCAGCMPFPIRSQRTTLRTVRMPLRCFSGISTQVIQAVRIVPQGNANRLALDDLRLARSGRVKIVVA
jgi:hypothetical protein